MDEYHRQVEEEIPTKVSVSDLKKKSMEEGEEENFTVLYSDALENQSPVPALQRPKPTKLGHLPVPVMVRHGIR